MFLQSLSFISMFPGKENNTMKKISHKIILLLLLISTLLISSTSVMAAETDQHVTRDEKIKVILETGAPIEFIEQLSDAQINDYYNQFQGKNIEYIGTETKEVLIQESDNYLTRGTIPASSLQLGLSVFEDKADYGGEVYGLIIGPTFKWLKQPVWSLTDGFTINWDASLFNYQSFYAETGFMLNGTWYSKDFTNTPAVISSGGLGFYLDIASGNLNQGSGSVYLVPRNQLYDWNDLNTQISFVYAHQMAGASISFGIGTGGAGSFGVGIAGGNYDSQAISTIYH